MLQVLLVTVSSSDVMIVTTTSPCPESRNEVLAATLLHRGCSVGLLKAKMAGEEIKARRKYNVNVKNNNVEFHREGYWQEMELCR